MLLTDARSPARTRPDGALVPLAEQVRGLWDQGSIREGVTLVTDALSQGPMGPYQLQAAIAAVHDEAKLAEDTDWPQILALYELLERISDNPVVTLNRAVAVAKLRGAEPALAMIEPLAEPLAGYFHFFGVKGALLMQLGRADDARVAFDRAIALANTAAEAAHIRQHLDRLIADRPPAAVPGR